jgi:hypothetical protein
VRLLGIHPGPLLYTKVFLRLELLGLELVAAAARCAGHTVRPIDLQVEDITAPISGCSTSGGQTSSRSPATIWQMSRRSSIWRRQQRRAFSGPLSASADTAPPSPQQR